MKKFPRSFAFILLVMIGGVTPAALRAQTTLYWDADGTGTVANGTGIWDTTLLRWATTANGNTYQAWVNGNTAAALPSGNSGVTLGANITAGQITGAGTITLTGYTLTLGGNNSDSTIETVFFNGTGKFIKAGLGTITTGSFHGHSGGTEIQAGALLISADVGLGATAGALTLNGGTLRLANNLSLSSARAVIVNTTGTIDTNGFNTTRNAAITGTGTLTKTGAGALTFSGTSLFDGSLVINAGSVALATSDALGSGAVTIDGPTAIFALGASHTDTVGTVTLAGGGSITGSGTSALTSTGSFEMQSGSVSAILDGAGIALNKTTADTVTLSGANTYTGATTINAGSLTLGAAKVLADSTAVTLANVAGATLNLADFSETIGSLAGGGTTGGNVTLGSGTLTVGDATSTVFSGIISGSAGGLIKQGAGTLTLSGANTYSGATTINNGTLQLGAGNRLSNSTAVTLADVAGATFDLAGFTETIGSLAGGGTSGGNVTLGAGSLMTSDNTSTTFAGIISGTGGFTKRGTGTLTLSGANTYSGTTTVNEGTLTLAAANRLADTTAVVLGTTVGTTFNLAGFNETIGSLSGGGTNGGNVTLGAGTLTTGDTTTANATFAGIISGTGGLTKRGTGTLTLSGSNTYSGATTISAGFLTLAAANRLADTTAVILANTANTAFNLAGFNETIGSLAGGGTTGGNVTLGAGTLTTGDTTTTTFAGVISGTGGLTKQGTGGLTLSGNNSYSGSTALNAGTLTMARATALGSGPVSIASGTTLDSATYNFDLTRVSGPGTLTGSGTYAYNSASDVTLASIVAGSASLTKSGTGTLTLSGGNTYSGATTINAGSLTLGTADRLNNATAVTLANVAGATFDLADFNETIGSLAGGGTTGGNVTLGAGTLTTGGSASTTFSGILSGTGGLTKVGSGVFTLSGNNTYTGATTINAGSLTLGAADRLADGTTVTLANTAGATFNLAGFNETIASLAGGGLTGGNVTLGAGTLTVAGSSGTLFSGVISGAGGLAKTGAGSLTLAEANTYTGGTTVSGGALTLGDSERLADTGALTVNGGTLDLGTYSETVGAVSLQSGNITGAGTLTGSAYAVESGSISALLAGSGALTKSTAGTVTLSGDNTYSGGTTVNAGTLALGNNERLANTSALLVNGGTLDLGTYSETVGTVSLQSGSITGTGTGALTGSAYAVESGSISALLGGSGALTKSTAGTVTLSSANTYSGGTAVNGGTLTIAHASALGSGTVAIAAGATLDTMAYGFDLTRLSGTGTLTGSGLHAYGSSSDQNLAATLAGSASLEKSGSGILTLSAANTYSGATTINAGTLRLGAADALSSSGLVLANSADVIFDLNGFSTSVASLTGGGSAGGTVSLGTGTLTVANNDYAYFNGIISGPGGLTKSGAGIFALFGANTYSGLTTINAGTLYLGLANALPITARVTLANAADTFLNIGGTDRTIGALSGGGALGGNVTLGSRTLTVGDSTDTTFAGTFIASTGSLVKQGSGTLTLSGSSSLLTTRIKEGTLKLGHDNIFATSAHIVLDDVTGATLDLNNRNFAIYYVTGGGSAGGNISLGSGRLTLLNLIDSAFAGRITGTGGLTKSYDGTLTLSGTNTYSGATEVTGGTLALGANHVLSDATAVTIASGAFLNLAGFTDTIGSLAGNGAVTLGSGALTVGSNHTNTNFGGSLSGTGSLAKTGTGTLTLAGANTYTGGTTVAGGALTLGASERLADTGALTVQGGTFDLGTYSETVGAVSLQSGSITGAGTLTGSAYAVESGSISALLAGSAALTKSTAGTVILSGDNTYTGGTILNAGTVHLNSTSALGSAGPITFAGGGLYYNVSGAPDYSGRIVNSTGAIAIDGSLGAPVTFAQALAASNTGGLTKSGESFLFLAADNAYTGTTTLANGTVILDSANALGTGSDTITFAGGILRYRVAGTRDYSDRIRDSTGAITISTNGVDVTLASALAGSNTGGLTMFGSGTLVLAAANLYTGTTTISGGTLALAADHAYTGATLIAGGTLRLDAGNALGTGSADITFDEEGSLQYNASGIADYSARIRNSRYGAIAIDTHGFDVTFASGLASSNTGGLTKLGAGTLTLAGANLYTGATTITAGTLQFANPLALTSAAALTVQSGATAAFNLGGAGEFNASGVTSLLGAATFQSGSRLGLDTTNATGPFAYGGAVTGSLGLTKLGTGTLTLSGANTYTGVTTIAGGTLQFANSLSLASASALTVQSGATAVFNLGGAGEFNASGVTSLLGTATFQSGSQLGLDTTNAAGPFTYGGAVTGSLGLTKLGTGTLILSGANTYAGGTTVSAGFIQLSANAPLGAGALTLNGGGIQYGAAFNDLRAFTLGASGGTLDTNGFAVTYAPGLAASTGGLTKTGAGTLTLTGTQAQTGTTTLNGGTLTVASGASLAGATAALTVTSGTLNLNNAAQTVGALTGAAGTAISLGSGHTLTTSSASAATFAGALSGAGAFAQAGTGTLTLTGANTYAGGTTLSAGTLQIGNGGTTGSITGNITNNAALAFNRSDVALSYAGNISGSGSLTKQGAGNVTLTGTNTYAGGTTVSAGALQIGNGGTTGSITGNILNNGGVVFNRSDALAFAGNISGSGFLHKQGAGTLTLTGDNTYAGLTTVYGGTLRIGDGGTAGSLMGNLNLTHGTAVVFDRSDASTYAGNITSPGSGSLTKNGAGTLTLTGINTYHGGTTINGGTLRLESASALNEVTIGSAGTLTLGGFDATFYSVSGTGHLVLDSGNLTIQNHYLDQTLAASISGTGGLILEGSEGTLILTGNNTYSGGTTLWTNTLALGSATALGSSGPITFGYGTLQFSANNTTDYSSRFSSSDNQRFIIDTNGQAVTFASAITSSGGNLFKQGAGTLTLSGPNTYTGGTVIENGTLALGATNALPTGGSVSLNGGTTLDLGGFDARIGRLNDGTGGEGHVALGAATLTTGESNVEGWFSGTISGTGSLVKTGTGLQGIWGTSTYTGPTTVSAGTLFFATSASFYNNTPASWTAANLIVESGATASFSVGGAGGFTAADIATLSTLGTATGGFRSGASLGLNTWLAGETFTYGGVIADPNGGANALRLTIAGFYGRGGVLLTGANTYTGGTTLAGGTLILGAADALPGGSTVTFVGGGTLDTSTYGFDLTRISGDNGVITGSGTYTYASAADWGTGFIALTGTAGLHKSGTGRMTLPYGNYTGATTISGGTLVLQENTASPSFAIASGAVLELGGEYSGRIAADTHFTGAGTLRKTEPIEWVWNINTTVHFALSPGGLIDVQAGTLGGGGGDARAVWTLNHSALNVATGAIFDGTGANVRVAALTGAGTIKSGFNSDGYTGFTFGVDDASSTFSGVLADSRFAGNYVKEGTGTQILTGANTYTGSTTIAGGTLQVGNGGTSGSLASSVIVNHAALVFNRSDSAVYAGAISGSGTVTKQGAGWLTLSGTNTYTGATTISGGTLQIGDGGASDSLASSVIVNNAALVFNRSNDAAYAGAISGTGTVTKQGAGWLTLSGANTYGGATTAAGGTLEFANLLSLADAAALTVQTGATAVFKVGGSGEFNSGTLMSALAAANFQSGARLGLDSSHAVGTFADDLALTGDIDFIKLGTGTVALGGTNAYTGDTTIAGGTLAFTQRTALYNATPADWTAANLLVQAGATAAFNVGGSGEFTASDLATITALGTSSGGFQAGSYVGFDTTNAAGGVFAYNGDLTDLNGGANALGLVKLGAGTLLLGGTNTYSGTTFVNAGTLRINGVNAFSPNTTIEVASGATFDANGFDQGFTDLTGDGNVNLGVSTLTVAPTGLSTYAGQLSGTGSLVMRGIGTQILSGDNTFTGTTTVTRGTLQIGAGGTSGSLTGAVINNAALVFNRSDALTQAGAISGTGSLTKLGAGILTLAGPNTYTGATTVSAGTLDFGPGTALITGAVAVDGVGTILALGANSSATVASVTLTQGASITGSGTSTLSTTGSFDLRDGSISASLGGSGTLNKTTGGTVTLSGANTYTGTTTIFGGTLAFGAGGTLMSGAVTIDGASAILALGANRSGSVGPVTLANGGQITGSGTSTLTSTSPFSLQSGSVSAILGGSGALNKTTGGTVTLTAANTYTGATTISGGTLALSGGNNRLPTTTVYLDNGASLDLGGNAQTLAGLGSSSARLVGNITAGTITTTGEIYLQSGTFANTFAGTSASGRLWIGGDTAATVTLTGANERIYTADHHQVIIGYVPVTGAAGTVRLGNPNALAANYTTEQVHLYGGTLDLNGQAAVRAASLNLFSGSASAVINSNTVTAASFNQGVILNAANTTVGGSGALSFGGAVSGTGGLNKTGAGALTLSGANTYTGATSVSAGTLVVDGSITSAVTINSGATLSGHGTVGAITVNIGATIAPGNSPGTLTTGSETWNGGANYLWEINNAASPATTAGTNYDLLSISGTLTINATSGNKFTLSLHSLLAGGGSGNALNFNSAVNSSYTIASATGGIFGFDQSVFTINSSGFTNNLNGGSWNLSQLGNNLNLNFAAASAIPEPSTYAMLFGALVLVVAVYRKRKARL